MGTLKLKNGMKLDRIEFHTGAKSGFRRLRVMPATRELLDNVAITIANEADRHLDGVRGDGRYDDSDAYIDHDVDGTYSKGNEARYRTSVRTSSNDAVRAEANERTLSKAFVAVQGKLK